MTDSNQPATSADLTGLLGEVEPIVLDQILALGATAGEVAEALLALQDESALSEVQRTTSTPRVAEVQAILVELLARDVEEEDPAADVG